MKRIFRDIKEFSTDGCTMSPDFDFRECCVRHDYDYYDQVPRKKADLKLKACIAKKGHPILARVYYRGVRCFGWFRYRKAGKIKGGYREFF
jgi:hypothetical protein